MKKYISLFLTGLMCVSSIIPSFAYDYDIDENGNSFEDVEYQSIEDEKYAETNVFAEIGSEYKVTIPKTVVLSGVTKNANYYVKVEGDIAGYETINVIPDESVLLYSINKSNQVGIITQDKITWRYDDFDIDANGQINAQDLTAGKWSGVFNFNISINAPEEYVLGDLVLPEDLDGDYRLKIKKINNKPGLYDDNGDLVASINELIDNYSFDPSKNDSSAGDIINTNYPNARMLVLPSTTSSIGDNAFINANLSYIRIPNSVTNIGNNAFNDNIKYINIPKSVSKIENNPTINKVAYYNNKKVKTIVIDLENNDSVEIELEKGCRYEIEALYNFVDNVTNESTIISNNKNIVEFTQDCYLDAIEVGQCTISGTYTTKNGNQKYAEIKVNVVDHVHNFGEYTDIDGYYTKICSICGKAEIGDIVNYNISYNLDGGKLSSQKTSYNVETATFMLPIPTKTGYTFAGWTGSNGTEKQVDVNIEKGSTGNKTYTANWTINNYDVNIYPSVNGTKYTSGKDGYTFTVYKDGKAIATNVKTYSGSFEYNSKIKIVANTVANYSLVETTIEKTIGAENLEINPAWILSNNLGINFTYGDYRLIVITESKTWQAAENYAQSLGGHLIMIKSADMQNYVYNTILANSTVARMSTFWIGATDRASEGDWRWADGTKLSETYSNWNSGEPNNANDEDYCQYYISSNRGKWNDLNGTQSYPFIIQINLNQ